jgi:hypothetical protein
MWACLRSYLMLSLSKNQSPEGHLWCLTPAPQVFREDGIISGYRDPQSSAKDCLLSSFQLTNETINIWTHFLPTWCVLVPVQTCLGLLSPCLRPIRDTALAPSLCGSIIISGSVNEMHHTPCYYMYVSWEAKPSLWCSSYGLLKIACSVLPPRYHFK